MLIVIHLLIFAFAAESFYITNENVEQFLDELSTKSVN